MPRNNPVTPPGFLAQVGKGRPKGVPNKMTMQIKEMIIEALDRNGGVDYLVRQAEANPVAFMGLLAKIIPMQVVGEGNGPLTIQVVTGVPRAGSDS